MKKPDIYKRKFIQTPDAAWFQAYPDGTVEVELHNKRRQRLTIISVWGDDDTGMIKYFEDYDEAINIFNNITNNITRKQLNNLGFKEP